MEVRKFLTSAEREVHMVGEYVGVCWNIYRHEVVSVHQCQASGDIEVTQTWKRYSPDGFYPEHVYIDFVQIDERHGPDEEGLVYEDDHPSVEGGITTMEALKLADELRAAVDYIGELADG